MLARSGRQRSASLAAIMGLALAMPARTPPMTRPEEPLELSAPLAHRMAPQLCRKDPQTGQDCSWLHGFWQCLRLMGLAATPGRHAEFYERAFRGVDGADGPPRILVSGAADYSMFAHVLASFRGRGIEPAVTVIDVCETPLELNRWYAERVSCRIETRRCGMLDFPGSELFDAVCSHSFFGQFPRERRAALFAAWHRVLRPGGLLATANPLRPRGPEEPNRFTPEQAQAFRAVVAAAAEELQRRCGIDQRDILQRAEQYLQARYGYPVRSGDDIREQCERAGFVLDSLNCAPVASDVPVGLGGPGLRKAGVKYASIIASRPRA